MDGLTIDEFLETKLQERIDYLNNNLFSLENEHNAMLKDFEKYTKVLLRAKKTANYGPVKRFLTSSRFKDVLKLDNDSEKENAINSSNSNPSIKVKKEKLSIPSQSACDDDTTNMPAPKMPPPKAKRIKKEKISNVEKAKQGITPEINASTDVRRVTRSNTDRTSDVILQNPVIPVVDLVESSEKEEEAPVRSTRTRTKKQAEAAPVRSTRTRTKKAVESKEDEVVEEPTSRTTRTKTTKRDRSESDNDSAILEKKRSKSDSSKAEEEQMTNNLSTHTQYEDAVSELDNKPNETFVISATKTPDSQQVNPMLPRMNETVVLDKSKPQQVIMNNPDDMMTDDESVEERVISPQKKTDKKNPKQLFSPYENSPVKKKVEAFEKIQKNENSTVSKLNTSKILKEMGENKGNVKEKAKGFIRTGSTNPYKNTTPTASKIGKYMGQKTSILNGSRLTPLSGHDFKERELRRLEKEKEQKKREMLKQAMSDEKKKKHDEKLLRIQQQQKEAKEKEMEKALQLQKMKEERVKMVLQQKEEKQRLLKEENERKRLLAKQRAEEKKKEEEALKLALQVKKEIKKKTEADTSSKSSKTEHLPIYLVQPTPPLPCADCYDSDDERRNNVQKIIPGWASKSRIKMQDYIQTSVGHRIKNTLFCCQSQNIDLRDVFKRIDERKLKRTSSAYWDKPPRFTLLPPIQDD